MKIYEPFLKCMIVSKKRKYKVKSFNSNFEKAFDNINHDYIFKSLKILSFSENFIQWIKLFYSNTKKLYYK